MKIDPSQLGEPLAHILKTGKVDKVDTVTAPQTGETGSPASIADQLEQLDEAMLRRMRQSAADDAANSLTSMYEARTRAAAAGQQLRGDADAARAAAGTPDTDRVRGLLG